MTSPIAQSVDTLSSGRTSTAPFITIITNRAPTGGDKNYQIGQRWVNNTGFLTATITGITNANPAVVTAANTFSVGQIVSISGVMGMTQINNFNYTVESTNGSQFTIDADSTTYGAYTSGGIASADLVEEYILVGFTSFLGNIQADWVLLAVEPNLDFFLQGNTGSPAGPNASDIINVVGDGVRITSVSDPATNSVTFTTVGSGVNETLTGNDAVIVPPSAGNINVVGDGTTITTTGNAGTSTLTIHATGSIATTYDADAGSAVPAGNILNIKGGTTGLTTSGAGSTISLTGVLKLANGGTNAILTASNGGIFYSTAASGAILSGTATANQMLQSGSSSAPAWSTTTWPATSTINQLLYSSAANTISGLATANDGVLITGNTGIPSWLANGSSGQVLTSTAGSPPSWQNSSGVSNWFSKAISFLAVEGDGYFVTASVTATLPTTPATGSTITIYCETASPIVIAAGGADTIQFANQNQTTWTSSDIGDSMTLVYDNAEGQWNEISANGIWS